MEPISFSARELAPELAVNLLVPSAHKEPTPKEVRLAAAAQAERTANEAARREHAAGAEQKKKTGMARGSGGAQIRKTGHCKGSTIVRAFSTTRIQDSTRLAMAPCGSTLRRAAPVQFRTGRGTEGDGTTLDASQSTPGLRHPVDVILDGSDYGARRRRAEDDLEFYRDLDRFFRRPIEPPEGVLRKERTYAIMKVCARRVRHARAPCRLLLNALPHVVAGTRRDEQPQQKSAARGEGRTWAAHGPPA